MWFWYADGLHRRRKDFLLGIRVVNSCYEFYCTELTSGLGQVDETVIKSSERLELRLYPHYVPTFQFKVTSLGGWGELLS